MVDLAIMEEVDPDTDPDTSDLHPLIPHIIKV